MKRKIGNVWKKKCFELILLAFVMLSVLPVQRAKADDFLDVKNNFKESVVYSAYNKGYKYFFYIYDINNSAGITIKQIKVVSSNKSVATVENVGNGFSFSLCPKKPGTTKITWTGIVDGKKIKRTGKVTVFNFQNPFSKLKVGGRNYLSKMKGRHNYIEIESDKSEVKLEYKLKSGWKVIGSSGGYYEDSSYIGKDTVKSGDIYPTRKKNGDGGFDIFLLLENKNGVEITTNLTDLK